MIYFHLLFLPSYACKCLLPIFDFLKSPSLFNYKRLFTAAITQPAKDDVA